MIIPCDIRKHYKWTMLSIRVFTWSSIVAICVTWVGVCYDNPFYPSGMTTRSPEKMNLAQVAMVSANQMRERESRSVSLDQRESMWGSQAPSSRPYRDRAVVAFDRVEEFKLLVGYVYLLCLVVTGAAALTWSAARSGYQMFRRRFRSL
jgi:hypothetical protein